MAKKNNNRLSPSSILKTHNIEANGLTYPLGRRISAKHKESIEARIKRIMNEKSASWTPPQIRTKFLKDKIKGARLGDFDMKDIGELSGSFPIDMPEKTSSDVWSIFELIQLEDVLYENEEDGSQRRWAYESLNEQYPDEALTMRMELCNNPKHDHKKEWIERKAKKEKEKKEETEEINLDGKAFESWWLESEGKR